MVRRLFTKSGISGQVFGNLQTTSQGTKIGFFGMRDTGGEAGPEINTRAGIRACYILEVGFGKYLSRPQNTVSTKLKY